MTTLLFLLLRRDDVDLCAAATVEKFAAKEEKGHKDQDDKDYEHGDDAGTRFATL